MLVGESGCAVPYDCSPGNTAGGRGRLNEHGDRERLPVSDLPCKAGWRAQTSRLRSAVRCYLYGRDIGDMSLQSS